MSGFILVKRDHTMRDIGVFTGTMTLVASDYELWPDQPFVRGEPMISEHIEHAYIFPGSWQAWRWADRLLPDPGLRKIAFTTYDVRAQDDFHFGELHTWGMIPRVDHRAPGFETRDRDRVA